MSDSKFHLDAGPLDRRSGLSERRIAQIRRATDSIGRGTRRELACDVAVQRSISADDGPCTGANPNCCVYHGAIAARKES